jgi:murein DD-endopeptidase MepM/ murein hydrolase activator NlpD
LAFEKKWGNMQKQTKGIYSQINKIKEEVSKVRKGSKFSRIARLFLDNLSSQKAHRVLLIGVGLSLLSLNLFSPISSSLAAQVVEVDNRIEEVVETVKRYQFPVRDEYQLSQRFYAFHPGVDFSMDVGTKLYPVSAGEVVLKKAGWFGYGNMVMIKHDDGSQALYAHLSQFVAKVGDRVDKDSVVGLSGNSGWSTGPHLHLQISDTEGKWINPLSVL